MEFPGLEKLPYIISGFQKYPKNEKLAYTAVFKNTEDLNTWNLSTLSIDS